jgi:two-component system response regulator PilR (NtrC family)
VLQEREFRRVGDSVVRKTDVRVLAASNRDLQEQVASGGFREDLYYRINVVQLLMPPLRDRIEDIPQLVDHFFQKYCEPNHSGETITPAALKLLMNYSFPGNIRELENVVERSLILDRQIISESSLPEQVRSVRTVCLGSEVNIPDGGMSLEPLLEELEKKYLLKALDKTGGAKKKAADLLGMSFRSFRYRLAKFGLDSGDE